MSQKPETINPGEALARAKLIPPITFGLEIELDFALSKQLYYNWLDCNPNLPTDRRDDRQRRADMAHREIAAMEAESFSTQSDDDWLRDKILAFFLEHLNHLHGHDTEFSRSKIGLIVANDPQTGSNYSWHLTVDESLHPHRSDLALVLGEDAEDMKRMYRVSAGELVSCVLKLDQQPKWLEQLNQISRDLTWNSARGAFVTETEHLHVHMAFQDAELELPVLQTICVLYGIYESEIETWLKPQQRDNMWCMPLRYGMQRRRLARPIDLKAFPEKEGFPRLLTSKRYTPNEFAEIIYDTKSINDLRNAISGYSYSELLRTAHDKRDFEAKFERSARRYVSVNPSPSRLNKDLTVEFRHHHGTFDPEEMMWWVRFCGQLVRFSYYIAKSGKLVVDRKMKDEPTFVDHLTTKWGSILDLIGFEPEGKYHFAAQKDKFRDDRTEAERELEDMFIKERIQRRCTGEVTGTGMDARIAADIGYADLIKRGRFKNCRTKYDLPEEVIEYEWAEVLQYGIEGDVFEGDNLTLSQYSHRLDHMRKQPFNIEVESQQWREQWIQKLWQSSTNVPITSAWERRELRRKIWVACSLEMKRSISQKWIQTISDGHDQNGQCTLYKAIFLEGTAWPWETITMVFQTDNGPDIRTYTPGPDGYVEE